MHVPSAFHISSHIFFQSRSVSPCFLLSSCFSLLISAWASSRVVLPTASFFFVVAYRDAAD